MDGFGADVSIPNFLSSIFLVWFCGMVLWYGFVLVESWKRMGVFRKRILADRKQEHVLQLHG